MKDQRWELSALYEIDRLLSGGHELPELVDIIVQGAVSLGNAQASWLALRSPESEKLEYSAGRNLSQKSIGALSADIDSWTASILPVKGEPAILTDLSRDVLLAQVAAKESVSAAAVVPILYNEQLSGVLVTFWGKSDHSIADNIETIFLLANQTGPAIENARLLSDARHRAAALDAIFNITRTIGASPKLSFAVNLVMDEANRLFGTDQSTIRLIDPNTRDLEIRSSLGLSKKTQSRIKLKVGQGVMGWVAEHGKPLVLNDVGTDPRFSYFPRDAEKVCSLMSVPLIVESKTIGVLTVASSTPKSFTKENESLLTTLASQAAVAIENARLYEQLGKRLTEQKVLYRMAQHLASALDVSTALQFIVNHLASNFRAKFATIRLVDETGNFLMTGATFGIAEEYIRHANENTQNSLDPSTPQGQSPAAVAFREKRVCAVSNITKDRRFTEWRKIAKMQSFTSVICIPMIPKDEPIGVLSMYFHDMRKLDPSEHELLQTAVRTAAIALQRAMLDERLLKEEVSRNALEEISHLKTEFISLVSHELRTPLTSIQGYVKLILAGHTGELNELQTEFLTTVNRNTDRLIALVSDLLDISRIESGRMELVLEILDLPPIIEREVESIKAEAEIKKIEVITDIEEDLPQVRADSHRLSQVISNLLSNAVKYSPDSSTVKISATQIGTNILVKVIDSGIGIAPEDRNKLFQRFYRGQSDAVRSTWGTGLGLAVTRSLVEMHGGKIWVESEKGQGSTFSFSIPAVLDS